jgi:pimeloyl-ACP methyl ester carboxylesterase
MLIEPSIDFIDVPLAGKSGVHKLAVYEWGDRDYSKQTVLCVHGLTRNGRDFDFLASALAPDYRVIAFDVAGRGKSERLSNPADYNYATYLADTTYLINKLGLHKIHYIGTSMGGIIGMMLVGNIPGLIKSLTLNDIGCLVPAAGLKRITQYVGATEFESRAAAEAELRARCAPYGIKDELCWQNLFKHSIEEIPGGRVRLAYDPAIIDNLKKPLVPITDVNLWGFWPKITAIPTLVLRGKSSDILPHKTAIRMQRLHPDLRLLEIDNVGHAPALMDAQQINAIRSLLEYERPSIEYLLKNKSLTSIKIAKQKIASLIPNKMRDFINYIVGKNKN